MDFGGDLRHACLRFIDDLQFFIAVGFGASVGGNGSFIDTAFAAGMRQRVRVE